MYYTQYLATRYDEIYPADDQKFDKFAPIEKPDSDSSPEQTDESTDPLNAARQEFQKIQNKTSNLFSRISDRTYMDVLALHEKLGLAEVNLRTRGLVGMVIGSSARKLMQPPRNMREFHKEKTDIDVLILDEFGDNFPRPFEWGVDWFVRPPGELQPTNGLVRLWYDVSIKKTKKRDKTPQPHDPRLPFYLDTNEMQLKYEFYPENLTEQIIGDTRRQISSRVLKPGLYLPPAAITKKIKSQAEKANTQIRHLLEQLKPLIRHIEEFRTSVFLCTDADVECVLRAIDIINRLNKWHFVQQIGLKNPENLKAHLNSPMREHIITELLKTYHAIENKCEASTGKDYSYLDYGDLPTTNALYPVLDNRLLNFKTY